MSTYIVQNVEQKLVTICRTFCRIRAFQFCNVLFKFHVLVQTLTGLTKATPQAAGMLVLHPSSRCDVCMDAYTFQTIAQTPHAIPCGHIFCRPCVCRCSSESSQMNIKQKKKLMLNMQMSVRLEPSYLSSLP